MRMAARQVRWAFNFGEWQPSEREWCRLVGRVQKEERERILGFRYQEDAKASLVGRIMLRNLLAGVSGMADTDLVLARTDRGKPVLTNVPGFGWDYNVSHSGSWTVLAAASAGTVGVDVMRTVDNRVNRLSEFFRLMTRQFTASEWESIRSPDTEAGQLSCFFRHWALKESYVKAVGTGLAIDLQTLDFSLGGRLEMGRVTNDTSIKVDGVKDDSWLFEESLLDGQHVVSVASRNTGLEKGQEFVEMSVEQLLSDREGQLRSDDWTVFTRMEPVKPF